MLSKDDVLGVSKLARLKLTDERVEKFYNQLSNVFGLFKELDEIDISNVPETSQVGGLKNVTRGDVVGHDEDLRPGNTEKLLLNVPKKDGSKIIVPKIIDSTSQGFRGVGGK